MQEARPPRKQPPFQEQKEVDSREKAEAMIDETIDESFPASDPPAWTSFAAGSGRKREAEPADGERPEAPPLKKSA